jgi:hypothetical protein
MTQFFENSLRFICLFLQKLHIIHGKCFVVKSIVGVIFDDNFGFGL